MTENKQEEKQTSAIDKLGNRWNKMAPWYCSLANEFMSPCTSSLLPHLKLNCGDKNGFNMLDVGIGDGLNTVRMIKELINNKSSFTYYGIDISKQMVTLTQKRIKNDCLLSLIANNNKYKINITLQNGENLSIYKNNTFHRYIASLCLMLTPSPINMIKEAYRILKPNGISGFTIWGYKQKSCYFETKEPLYKLIHKELGMKMKEEQNKTVKTRSNYDLASSIQDTVAMFKSVGFSKIYYWDINCALPVNKVNEWIEWELKSPKFGALLKKCKDDMQKEKIKQIFMDGIKNKFDESVVNCNKQITHNVVCIIAIK
eukprot:380383_1